MDSYYDSAGTQDLADKSDCYHTLRQHGIAITDPEFTQWVSEQSWPIVATKLLDWLGY
jgi:hypothetical protein